MSATASPRWTTLVLFGHAGPIGAAGGIAVIMGGLFLLYRGLIDVRIPTVIILVALASFLLLPIPAVITERAVTWRWLPIFDAGIGVMRAVTFACYEVFAGPLVFIAFFFATSPAVRPLNRRARTLYAAVIGLAAAVFQLYASVAIGGYLALLLAGLFAPHPRRPIPRSPDCVERSPDHPRFTEESRRLLQPRRRRLAAPHLPD